MSFYYDPEVPAGYQDADIEMAELEAQAREAEAEAAAEAAEDPNSVQKTGYGADQDLDFGPEL